MQAAAAGSSAGTYGTILQGAGTIINATGQLEGGRSRQATAGAEAAQLERNAGQLTAQGQFEGEEELRKSRLVQSRILAVAGASGASVLDPTVLNLIGVNAAEGSLAAATRRYNAASKAQDTRYQAAIRRSEGQAHARAGRFAAFGTALSGFGQMMASK